MGRKFNEFSPNAFCITIPSTVAKGPKLIDAQDGFMSIS